MKEFLQAHMRTIIERAKQELGVLAVQDTSSLNYTGLKHICEGPGSNGTKKSGAPK